ncbi:hypothetical protein [Hymenobacter daecheongensis]|uniref:hypothetical protein n=1 Tax=Hymenobacter daecheongensis TaxID=496053 RepID=UPI00093302A4|nr:hypothetical protein [Hymenobacter daecheongensis]
MEALTFIGILIIIFLAIAITPAVLTYFIPKKLGYPKTAKYLTAIYAISALAITFFIVFEDQFFTKNDARKLVEEQEVKLIDEFTLVENESMFAIGDYYHTFTLKISARDRQQIINEIKKSKSHKSKNNSIEDLLYQNDNRYFGPKIVQIYETDKSYIREYFKPSGRQGYAPTFRRISISKTENKLIFEDINE